MSALALEEEVEDFPVLADDEEVFLLTTRDGVALSFGIGHLNEGITFLVSRDGVAKHVKRVATGKRYDLRPHSVWVDRGDTIVCTYEGWKVSNR